MQVLRVQKCDLAGLEHEPFELLLRDVRMRIGVSCVCLRFFGMVGLCRGASSRRLVRRIFRDNEARDHGDQAAQQSHATKPNRRLHTGCST